MSSWRIQMVSAFGRGETLALALFEAGFHVQILDFTTAFANEYNRGVGPFPIVEHEFHPGQRAYLQEVQTLPQGLSFWLKEGPVELTGPLSKVHTEHHPEIQAWRALLEKASASESADFSVAWLSRFLRTWTSPYFSESWEPSTDPLFPAQTPLGIITENRESNVQSFARAQSRGIEVHSAHSFGDSRVAGGRILQIEAVAGARTVVSADQWIWCLSSAETAELGKDLTEKLFWRGVRQPEWVWLSFAGQMQKGPWTDGLPAYCVVMGDIYLPWLYANSFILRRVDETRCRFWLKVPTSRVQDIDARREWARGVQQLLAERLPLADWKIDSADWNLCPHSMVFAESQRGESQVKWKNWEWIAPETLPRLDISARLRHEAEVLRRLTQWRIDQTKKLKKQGATGDHSLHAP